MDVRHLRDGRQAEGIDRRPSGRRSCLTAGSGAPAAKRGSVDVAQTLTALERRLDELEADLEGGQILKSSIRDCAKARSGPSFRIVVEALADIHALAALERALGESPRVRTVELQAYAGGWASLVVDVA
jgi:hypothetical protein